ncbi:MAG: hypothetical protein M0R48_03230 [Candidatus Omnitrophica bacterium]|jgi:hypothetical protein|nr:hypothetical protein [Candidatus Omnitrophota bacterium]
MRKIKYLTILILIIALGFVFYHFGLRYFIENQILKQVISRLNADSRVAQVMVTNVKHDMLANRDFTTIKFVEFDVKGKPLTPKYFTFTGNLIQFQSMVIRFNDSYVEAGDSLRGKSIYLFWKVFMLNDKNTEVFDLANVNEVPRGYKISNSRNRFEEKIWKNFWGYALSSRAGLSKGIKNAQIEAPGTKFIPGVIYTIKIEHDGGLRIDTSDIPEILKGEKVPS